MKKYFAATFVLLVSTFAQARTVCAVTAEEKPNEYTKTLATKELSTVDTAQIVYQEGETFYSVTNKASGEMSFVVYTLPTQKVHAAAITQNADFLSLMLPELHRAMSCSTPKVSN